MHSIPTDPFTLNNKKLNFNDFKYLEIDFITCDWCLSSLGQATLQSRLNTESIFLWLRGYNLKLNYNSVGHMTIYLRGDHLAINYLLDEINKLTADAKYWQKYR